MHVVRSIIKLCIALFAAYLISSDRFFDARALILYSQNVIKMKRSGKIILLMIGTYYDEFDAIYASCIYNTTNKRWVFLNETCYAKNQENYHMSLF